MVSCLSKELMKQERRRGEKTMAKKVSRSQWVPKHQPGEKKNQTRALQHKKQDHQILKQEIGEGNNQKDLTRPTKQVQGLNRQSRGRNKEGKENARPLKQKMAPNQQQASQHKRQDKYHLPAPKQQQPWDRNRQRKEIKENTRSSNQTRQDNKTPNSKFTLVQKPNLR